MQQNSDRWTDEMTDRMKDEQGDSKLLPTLSRGLISSVRRDASINTEDRLLDKWKDTDHYKVHLSFARGQGGK